MAVPGITSPVPKETTEQITQFAKEAEKPAGELSKGFLKGTEMPKFLAPSEGVKGQVDSKALSAAIDQRALRSYRSNISQLKSDVETKAIQMKFNRLTSAAQLVSAEHQQNERIKMNKYIAEQNRRKARAAVLGNVLGIGGAIGGAIVGGPAGAAAGYQIGQGLGQASAN